jgi:cell division septum initiation protein DivIVA
VELETLLRSTLVSAERAAHDMKDQARREAEVTVAEASAEGRKLVRDAIAEKERLLAESRRVESILRAALEVISEGRSNDEERAEEMRRPSFPAATDTGADRLAG